MQNCSQRVRIHCNLYSFILALRIGLFHARKFPVKFASGIPIPKRLIQYLPACILDNKSLYFPIPWDGAPACPSFTFFLYLLIYLVTVCYFVDLKPKNSDSKRLFPFSQYKKLRKNISFSQKICNFFSFDLGAYYFFSPI